ncbi:partial acetyl-CoA synthetase, partial [Anaerolineae bacterium]
MSEHHIYRVKPEISDRAHINQGTYAPLYAYSIEHPEAFWAGQAEFFLDWMEPWHTVLKYDYKTAYMRWFEGGLLNVSYNCLDRHLATRGEQTAIIWEGDNPAQDRKITYRELHIEVCKFANVLKAQGVRKGDTVCIYLPMILEAAVVMLACARIGAVHSIVFGGFSAESLKDRILDANTQYLVCADEGLRGGKTVPIKATVDTAAAGCPMLKTVIVIQNTAKSVEWTEGRDVWYHELMADASDICAAEPMNAEDPLFILYTSGSTGKPKGVQHTTGGYLLYAAMTH